MMAAAHQTTKQPEGAETADKLSPDEVKDERDVTPRVGGEKPTGKRVRAIPYHNATTVRIRPMDFKLGGIDHPKVEWDFRKDNFTVAVGPELSQEAADYLTENFPTDFEYINDGSDDK
jgi:hypothetical protein